MIERVRTATSPGKTKSDHSIILSFSAKGKEFSPIVHLTGDHIEALLFPLGLESNYTKREELSFARFVLLDESMP